MKKIAVLSVFLVLLFSGSAFALQATFFGEDEGLGESTPLVSYPNSAAAEAEFLSNLVGVGTETFETYSTGTGAPLGINFPGAGTATLLGDGAVETVTPGYTNGFGRYAISGSNYWEVTGSFSINFSEAVAAFGFYGVDMGDFNGSVIAQLVGGETIEYVIPHGTNVPGGGVIYWGVIDTENLFTSVMFSNTAAGVDYFAFDNFTIGSVEQVVPAPEPGTIFMMGFGLLGLAGMGRKKLFKK